MIVPPTPSKANGHRELPAVWQRAAKRLSEAQNIIVIGYSWPDGDHFFHQLYALGTVGDTILLRFWVFNPDERVRAKFREHLLGQQARDCFGPQFDRPEEYRFDRTISHVMETFGISELRWRDRLERPSNFRP